jgi:hypothetical protein
MSVSCFSQKLERYEIGKDHRKGLIWKAEKATNKNIFYDSFYKGATDNVFLKNLISLVENSENYRFVSRDDKSTYYIYNRETDTYFIINDNPVMPAGGEDEEEEDVIYYSPDPEIDDFSTWVLCYVPRVYVLKCYYAKEFSIEWCLLKGYR